MLGLKHTSMDVRFPKLLMKVGGWRMLFEQRKREGDWREVIREGEKGEERGREQRE